jgi:hypothetical protein
MPPAPAIAAAVLALPGAAIPVLFALVLSALAEPDPEGVWIWLLGCAVLAGTLVTGAVLLLIRRSWLALALPAGVLTALVLLAFVMGGRGGGPFGVVILLVPAGTAVLAALPGVRGWVAARRQARK